MSLLFHCLLPVALGSLLGALAFFIQVLLTLWQLAIGKLSFLLQMLVLYYLETWEGKDGRDGGRRIAEAFLSTLGEASVGVFVLFTGIGD